MTILWILLRLVLWLVCAVVHYFVFRWAWTKTLCWTTADRRFAIVLGSLGPFALVASLVLALVSSDKKEKPARW